MNNDRVIEVVVDGEIVKSNTNQDDAKVIKDRALVKGASKVSIVIARDTYNSTYTFKNIEDYKDNTIAPTKL